MPVSECIHSSDMSGVCITEVSFPQLCSRRNHPRAPQGEQASQSTETPAASRASSPQQDLRTTAEPIDTLSYRMHARTRRARTWRSPRPSTPRPQARETSPLSSPILRPAKQGIEARQGSAPTTARTGHIPVPPPTSVGVRTSGGSATGTRTSPTRTARRSRTSKPWSKT